MFTKLEIYIFGSPSDGSFKEPSYIPAGTALVNIHDISNIRLTSNSGDRVDYHQILIVGTVYYVKVEDIVNVLEVNGKILMSRGIWQG